MAPGKHVHSASDVSRFDRRSLSGRDRFTRIGSGSLGAKANCLAAVGAVLENQIAPRFRPAIAVDIPLLTVVATDFFDLFLDQNGLVGTALSSLTDEQILLSFQRAELPSGLVDDLRAFTAQVHRPLAIRPSSLLEDALQEPLTGAYAARMIPNNHPDSEERLRQLSGAVKHAYASTFFGKAGALLRAAGRDRSDEKMAVIIQEVVGTRRDGRFYPHVSGVARSLNFYPTGLSRPEDGVIELALGLGKSIMDDCVSWSFSPAYPRANPPYNTLDDLIQQTQKTFWAIDLTGAGKHEIAGEAEHLKKYSLLDAERDGTLSFVASTYRAEDEKIVMGISGHGPRILDFGQLLKADLLPLTPLIKDALECCEELFGRTVEIEFAMTFPDPDASPARFGLLQVRPMLASHSQVEVGSEDLIKANVLVASESALGNGSNASIRDVVYVNPQAFDIKHTRSIGLQLEAINRRLVAEECPYVLIGFGRWGSSDPSAGIPVNFKQVSGARVIVEATLPSIDFIPSQGSHFFHKITRSRVFYFSISEKGALRIDWGWLDKQTAVGETEFIRHIRLLSPLTVKVDGRTGRGVIIK
jgi:hypothetical protein